MWAPSYPLPDNLRRVSALHLRVSDVDDAGRARIAIEDGLASADFGDCGRLIYVRRLALPAFATRFNGPAAARAIEASFRALLPEAVHGGEPHAASAPMVWFADVLEARLTALSHRVEGRALTAWFWRHVDPSFARETEPAIADVFAALERMNEGAITPVVAMKELARRWRRWSSPAFERFLTALPAVAESGSEPAPPQDTGPPAPIYKSEPPIRVLAAQAAARLSLAARVAPARAAWLARWELIAADIMHADSPRPVQDTRVRELSGHALSPARIALAPASIEREIPADARGPSTSEPRAPPADARPDGSHEIAPRPDAASRAPRASARARFELPPWLTDAQPTAHAGFFLLLNAWHAVGADDWIAADAGVRRDAWLERWARGFGLPMDDVQQLAWQSPALLQEADERELAHLRHAARRWLRTVARIGPASLVVRPGAVAITGTHIDVVLPLHSVDLRVRRVGLDQDPGWVSWLGRIVAFHYVEAGNAP
jgi:hypothetical protein